MGEARISENNNNNTARCSKRAASGGTPYKSCWSERKDKFPAGEGAQRRSCDEIRAVCR